MKIGATRCCKSLRPRGYFKIICSFFLSAVQFLISRWGWIWDFDFTTSWGVCLGCDKMNSWCPFQLLLEQSIGKKTLSRSKAVMLTGYTLSSPHLMYLHRRPKNASQGARLTPRKKHVELWAQLKQTCKLCWYHADAPMSSCVCPTTSCSVDICSKRLSAVADEHQDPKIPFFISWAVTGF